MENIEMFIKSRKKNIKKKTIVVFCLGLLFSSCERDPDIGLYIIESDGTMSKPTFDIIVDAVTDYDGNTYAAVKIGDQVWMKENLRTTHYADGASISQGSNTSTTVAYWYYPNNSTSNKTTYGLLYNWKAVMRDSPSSSSNPSGVQGICPNGWHVPSDAEWSQLTGYLGSGNGDNIAKALAADHGWQITADNECAVGYDQSSNNATGFSALPAGYYSGSYDGFGYVAHFWSATESTSTNSYYRNLKGFCATVERNNDNKNCGYSVRCVRN